MDSVTGSLRTAARRPGRRTRLAPSTTGEARHVPIDPDRPAELLALTDTAAWRDRPADQARYRRSAAAVVAAYRDVLADEDD